MPRIYLQTNTGWQRYSIKDTAHSEQLQARNIHISPGCTLHEGCAIGNGIRLASGSVIASNYLLLPYGGIILVNVGGIGVMPITGAKGGKINIEFDARHAQEWPAYLATTNISPANQAHCIATIEAIQALFAQNPHWPDVTASTAGFADNVHRFNLDEFTTLYDQKNYSTFGTSWV